MSDQVDELLREIETLRDALKGRTVSCSDCEHLVQERDELIYAIRAFVDLNRGTHGRQWLNAYNAMCKLANVKP